MSLLGDFALQQCHVQLVQQLEEITLPTIWTTALLRNLNFCYFALGTFLCKPSLLRDKIKNRGAQEIVECEVFSCKDLAPPTQIPPTHSDPTRQVHLGAKGDQELVKQLNSGISHQHYYKDPVFSFYCPTTLLHTQFSSKGQCRNSLPIILVAHHYHFYGTYPIPLTTVIPYICHFFYTGKIFGE